MLPKCYQTIQRNSVHSFMVFVAKMKLRLQKAESHAKHGWNTRSIPATSSFRSSSAVGFLLLGYDFVSFGYRIPTFRGNVVTSSSRAEMFVLG
jgi:hypothetical protein